MSKNLTHKSLAIGAGLALLVSGLAAVPAQASIQQSVTLTPTQGSTYNSILQSGISLISEVDQTDSYTTQGADGSVVTGQAMRIENPNGAPLVISVDINGGAVSQNEFHAKTSSADFTNTGTKISSTVATRLTTTDKFIVVGYADFTGASQRVTIETTETTKNVNFSVQAFYDADEDGFIDTFDRVSPKRDVNLYAPANVSATTSIDKLVYTGTTFRASVVYGQGINPFFQKERTGIRLLKDGATVALESANGNNVTSDIAGVDIAALTKTGTAGYTKNTLSAGVDVGNGNFIASTLAQVANGFYTAVAFYDTLGTDLNTVDAGLIRMGGPSRVEDLTAGSSAAASKIAARQPNGVNQVSTTTDGEELTVRSGATEANFGAQIRNTTGDALRVSNVEVRATLTGTVLDEDTEITVTGSNQTLTSTSGPIVAFARTNSLGQVDFVLTSSTGKKNDEINVVLEFKDSFGAYSSNGIADSVANGGTDLTGTLDILFADATASVKAKPAEFVSGANPSVTIAVEDQFGEPISVLSDERLSVFASAYIGGVEDAATYSERLSVVDGEVLFTFANFATAGSSAELRVQAYQGATTTVGNSISVIVYNTADTAEITVANSFTTDITYTDFVVGSNKDATVAAELKATGLDSETTRTEITGNVLNEDGSGQPGAAVTLSADGFLFYDDGAGLYAEDTISVTANEFGAFDVFVYAHEVVPAGATVTLTSDGVSEETLVSTHLPSTGVNRDVLNFDWDFPEVLVVNSTYGVTATLTDKWGNAIATDEESVHFEGNGSVQINGVAETTKKDFNRNGSVTVYVRSLKDIAGPGAVTATLKSVAGQYAIEPASDGTPQTAKFGSLLATTTDLEATEWDETLFNSVLEEEVEVYETAADAPQSSTQKVNAGSFKGFVALYAKGYEGQRMSAIVAGKWLQVDSLASNYERVVRFTGAGYDIKVRIYIDGEQVGPEFDILTK